MKNEQIKTAQKNAQKVARKYKRKCWWVEVEDLEQEAIKAQLEAARTFDVARGNWEQYSWRVAVLSIHEYVQAQSAPVTAGLRNGKPLRNLTRAPVESIELAGDLGLAYGAQISSEKQAALAQVNERVEQLVGKDGAVFAYGMLVEGWHPSEVAKAHKMKVKDVYAATQAVRTALSDRVLHDMWSQL